MNQTSGETGPKFEVPASPQGIEAEREKAMERRKAEESATGKQQPQMPGVATLPTTSVADDIQASAIPQQPPQSRPSQASATADLAATDSNLIEKQWVDKAKVIVAQTQDDPYNQKKEISKAGADYIQKRFNKTIPTDDTVAA